MCASYTWEIHLVWFMMFMSICNDGFYIILLGKFDHDRALFSRALE